jgi:hypothetical protein
MKNEPKNLPKDTKFSTFNSGNEDDMLLEILIANLIYNGKSFKSLIKIVDTLEKSKDREEMKAKITNIILDFIKLNPNFTEILNRNDEAENFLSFLGLEF